jgi:trehalose synthase
MHSTLAPTAKRLDDYLSLIGREKIDDLKRLAEPLKGLRVLNLSVTAFGTGVAELLRSSVPLFSDLGLDCQWQVLHSDGDFARVNKVMYQALAGGQAEWSDEMAESWYRYAAMNAEMFQEEFDVVIVHDPQPAALRALIERKSRRRSRCRWIMHSHIDLSSAQKDAWELVRSHIEAFDALIFEDRTFVGEGIKAASVRIIPPAIDPLGPRNMKISAKATASILGRYGIEGDRPLIAQVAPLSRDSDALGAIEVFGLARERLPDLQLVLVATSPPEDPIAHSYFERVNAEAGRRPDVYILSNPEQVGNVEVNVVQRAARVVLQRALRRGFGIWLADALWKETPVVAAPMGGIPQQVIHDKTGYLADNAEEFAGHIVDLIEDATLAQRLGAAGRQHVADNFLVCRYLGDYLRLLQEAA